eukprot:6182687-Pleurochrysis_carterae.AAC.1
MLAQVAKDKRRVVLRAGDEMRREAQSERSTRSGRDEERCGAGGQKQRRAALAELRAKQTPSSSAAAELKQSTRIQSWAAIWIGLSAAVSWLVQRLGKP